MFITFLFAIHVIGIYLWHNWKKLNHNTGKKWKNTWMILFLGPIGMWLWLPKKNEALNMQNKNS